MQTSPFGSLTGGEIVDQALASTAEVKTLRIRTTLEERGFHEIIDLRRTEDGTCYGKIILPSGSGSLITDGDHTFLRASATFWRTIDIPKISAVMARTPGKWARFPAVESDHELCDVQKLPKQIGLSRSVLDGLRAGAAHYGNDSRTVIDLSSPQSESKVTVDVAAPHYLLGLRTVGAHAELSEFNGPASVSVPAEGEYVVLEGSILGA